MSETKMGYGFIDDTDESLRSKAGGKFGLNSAVNLIKFEKNMKAGKDGADGIALDITFKVEDKELNLRTYPTTKVYDNNNVEITDVNSPQYIKKFNEEVSQKNAVILHVLKSVGVTTEQIKAVFAQPLESFEAFIDTLVTLLPSDFRTRPVDLFLEYQWNISEGQDRTFLNIPKNMKGGYFAVPAQPGTWEEVRVTDQNDSDFGKLFYRNATGQKHPFERDKNFMESNKAKQQFKGQSNNNQLAQAAGMSQGTGGAQSGTW